MEWFGFFSTVSSCVGPPNVDTVHCAFFNGMRVNGDILDRPLREKSGTPMRIVKNIYKLAPAFTVDTRLVVAAEVKSIIEANADVRFQPVAFEMPFMYPYAIGDESFLRDRYWVSEPDVDDIVIRFAKAYPCLPPEQQFYHVSPVVTAKTKTSNADLRSYTLRDVQRGLNPRRVCKVSPSLLAQHGMMWSMGYQCTPSLFELLNPYLRRPFFWCAKVDVKSGEFHVV